MLFENGEQEMYAFEKFFLLFMFSNFITYKRHVVTDVLQETTIIISPLSVLVVGGILGRMCIKVVFLNICIEKTNRQILTN